MPNSNDKVLDSLKRRPGLQPHPAVKAKLQQKLELQSQKNLTNALKYRFWKRFGLMLAACLVLVWLGSTYGMEGLKHGVHYILEPTQPIQGGGAEDLNREEVSEENVPEQDDPPSVDVPHSLEEGLQSTLLGIEEALRDFDVDSAAINMLLTYVEGIAEQHVDMVRQHSYKQDVSVEQYKQLFQFYEEHQMMDTLEVTHVLTSADNENIIVKMSHGQAEPFPRVTDYRLIYEEGRYWVEENIKEEYDSPFYPIGEHMLADMLENIEGMYQVCLGPSCQQYGVYILFADEREPLIFRLSLDSGVWQAHWSPIQ